MDTSWKTLLAGEQVLANDDAAVNTSDLINQKQPRLYPLLHLSSLTVTGKDAAKLLQGQLTCNVNEVSENKSCFTAMCNPKGRVIATFLLVKKADAFMLLLPADMLAIVQKRLQMFVLRSDVKINDSTDALCLLGISEPEQPAPPFAAEINGDLIKVNLPGNHRRKILIVNSDMGLRFWSEQSKPPSVSNAYQHGSVAEWRYLDIVSGTPWITTATTEEFIPQMLNLDKLGGISFNKGCYTGQEIVARTHYLGKAKRELVLAECEATSAPEPNCNVINAGSEEQEIVGKVLIAQQHEHGCVLQIVLHINENGYSSLRLEQNGHHPIKLILFLS